MAQRALQYMGGVATTVVLAACYGGFDMKDTGTSDSGPTTGTGLTVGTPVGTPVGSTTLGVCGAPSADFAITAVWTDDGLPPSDQDGDGVNETNCDADTVEICVQDPLGLPNWSVGMAEDGANGWVGEDCIGGMQGFDICHTFPAPSTILTEVCTPGEVGNDTTLLDATKDPFLTYFLEDSDGNCFVFGVDVAYYAGIGCTEMM